MKRCLVLGGAGFLGSHVCESLAKGGYAVRVFEKERVTRKELPPAFSGFEWVEGDFTNENDLKRVVEGVDFIVHAICTTKPSGSNDNPVYDVSSNLISTLHLLDAARDAGVGKIIFFSSGGTVYGVPREIPIPEDHPNNPLNSYGIHKLTIEKYLALYKHLYGLDYSIMRISNPYGERQVPVASQGAVTVFLYKALKGEGIEIWGDGSVVRDYLHVSDVARAAVMLLEYQGAERIFNIGSGHGLNLIQLIEAIEGVVGHKVTVNYKPGRPLDVPANVLDITRARKELGWAPEMEFEKGLRLTADYLTRHFTD